MERRLLSELKGGDILRGIRGVKWWLDICGVIRGIERRALVVLGEAIAYLSGKTELGAWGGRGYVTA